MFPVALWCFSTLDMNRSHTFFQGVLSVINTLVGGRNLKELGPELGLLFSGHHCSIRGSVVSLQLQQKFWGSCLRLAPFPLRVCPSLPHWHLAGARGTVAGVGGGLGCGEALVRRPRLFLRCHLWARASDVCPPPCLGDASLGLNCFYVSQLSSPWPKAPLSLTWSCAKEEGLEQCLSSLVERWQETGEWQEFHLPCLRSASKSVHAPSWSGVQASLSPLLDPLAL